jgi:hypothetical protein
MVGTGSTGPTFANGRLRTVEPVSRHWLLITEPKSMTKTCTTEHCRKILTHVIGDVISYLCSFLLHDIWN